MMGWTWTGRPRSGEVRRRRKKKRGEEGGKGTQSKRVEWPLLFLVSRNKAAACWRCDVVVSGLHAIQALANLPCNGSIFAVTAK
jgi:hypothetical protein